MKNLDKSVPRSGNVSVVGGGGYIHLLYRT